MIQLTDEEALEYGKDVAALAGSDLDDEVLLISLGHASFKLAMNLLETRAQ
jgi:hypothetical protein